MRRRHQAGFTLIEVVVFIVVSSLLMTTILLAANTALRNTPKIHQQWVALQLAQDCMEWFIGQRRVNGYHSVSCPSTPSTASCQAPSGYSVSASVSCTTWNGDSAYKTLTISVTGLATSQLSMQFGEY